MSDISPESIEDPEVPIEDAIEQREPLPGEDDEDQDEEHLSITGPVSQVVNPWQCALEEGHEGAHILSDPGWMRPANQCAEIAKGVPQR